MTTPALLLPYQQKWMAAAYKHQIRVYEKSRRIGISWTEAAFFSIEAARAKGDNCWYIGYNKDMSKQFIDDCGYWSKLMDLAASEVHEGVFKDDADNEIHFFSIRYASGNSVTALSSRPANLRGKAGNFCIDEAAFHDDLPGLIKAVIAAKIWGGKISIISTHNGVDDDFNVLINNIRAGRKTYYLQRTTIDDALGEGLYERICMVTGVEWTAERQADWLKELFDDYGDDTDEELRCIPAKSGGPYLSAVIIEKRMITAPVIELKLEDEFCLMTEDDREIEIKAWCEAELDPLLAKLPTDRAHYFGEDFARVADLTVLVPATLERDLTRRVPFTVELRNTPYKQQEYVVHYILDRLPLFQAAKFDAGGNGGYIAEQAVLRYGKGRIEAVMLSDKWYRENLPPMKAALEKGSLLYPRNDGILADLKHLKIINGTPKLPKVRTKDAKGMTRHGDTAIGLAMMYAASKTNASDFSYTPIPKRGTRESKELARRVQITHGFKSRRGAL